MSDHERPTEPTAPHDGARWQRIDPSLELQPGQEIGPYRLQQRLGEGGMGVVWLAEQQRPMRRRVALKIIKPGMDSRRVVARFATERQVLARLDHPHIARVYDAGTTVEGRPYFVMEYVPGEPITDYCDRHQLDVHDRLELFLQVCEGVQHAHRNAIIHRDLKPHNVLVTVLADRPVPKIIDFGVAKAIDQQAAGETLFTEIGQVVGTLEYMSPEQADASGLDIDTRADVYALGVLLYELLTGALPFDPSELRRSALDEVRRRIREEEPPLPSSRLQSLGPKTEDIARRHRTTPGRLVSELRGDLDWIVMRALEKDRTRRYGSPTELADDLRRHLRDEPVLAGPPSALYRARKFLRRHTMAVAFTALTSVLLVAIAATMTVQAGRIAQERDRANAEAATAQQVSEFLVGLFGGVDPTEARGRDVTAREILDAGVGRIGEDLADQPAVQATLMRTMARVYIELSLFDQAEPLIRQAVAVAERGSGVDELELAAGLYELAKLCTWTDRNQEAERLARRSLALRESRLGPDAAEVAASLNAIGIALHQQGRLDEAVAAQERALAIRERVYGPEHQITSASVHNLASVHYYRGDLETAARLYRRSADIELESGGRENHHYATSLHTLAMVRQEQGRFADALALEEEALAIRERVLGPDHHHTALSLSTMAAVLAELGRADEGVALGRRALAIGERRLGAGHPDTGWMRENLATALAAAGRDEEAAALRENVTD